jgi:hypothetical protein
MITGGRWSYAASILRSMSSGRDAIPDVRIVGRSALVYRSPEPVRSTTLDPARRIAAPSIMAVNWPFVTGGVFA